MQFEGVAERFGSCWAGGRSAPRRCHLDPAMADEIEASLGGDFL
jgi:hypothetical protein